MKTTVQNITKKEWYSLHDLSLELKVDKHTIMEAVRKHNIHVGYLFGKYTVFTQQAADQVKTVLGVSK